MRRKLDQAQLDYIAMQVFVQDAALEAATALGVPLAAAPLAWDDGTMELVPGPHKIVLESAGRTLALSIAHGRADDEVWRSGVRDELLRGLAALKQGAG